MKKMILKNQHFLFPVFDIALNGFNYFFHIFISWYLMPDDYGVLNSLLSFSAILLVAGIAFQTYTAKSVAENKEMINVIMEIFKVCIIFVVFTLCLLFITLPVVKNFTRGGYSSVILIIFIFTINIFLSVLRGIMQGSNQFLNLNISFYIEVFSKLIFLFVLLPRNNSINTALFSIIIGMFFSLLHSVYINRGEILNNSTISFKEIRTKDSFIKISKVYIASFFFYFYTSIDMIIVNYYLPNDSGYYAVILKYSQILLFVSFSMITVFIPLLSRSKDNLIVFRKYIFTALALILLISISAVIIYRFFAPKTVTFFFGEKYAEAQKYLTLGLLPYIFLVLSHLFINIHIVLENTRYLILLLFFSLIIFILLNLFHSNIKIILYSETVCYGLLFAMLVIQYVITIRKRGRQMNYWRIRLSKSSKKTILFLSWRDIKAPKRGGAEVYTHEMLKRIDFNKYRIIHISPMFEGGKEEEIIDNIIYLRKGGLLSVIGKGKKYYKKNKENIDYVVEQCNTHRFFTKFWVEREKRIFFIHQLTREIWYINTKFPINFIGYHTEIPFLKLSKRDATMTVSNSTRQGLLDIGFEETKVKILPEGIEFKHWKKEEFLKKEGAPTFIYVGRFAKYKGIDATVQAFSEFKKTYKEAKLWIVGKKNEQYINLQLKPFLNGSNISFGDENQNKDVTFYGFVSDEKKLELMSRSHALIFPSRREGWGLIVTEAAAVGTPSIVYNSPGIIDAVDFGKSGYLCEDNSVDSIVKLMKRVVEDQEEYEEYKEAAYTYSLNFHWDNTAEHFEKFIDIVSARKE